MSNLTKRSKVQIIASAVVSLLLIVFIILLVINSEKVQVQL
jgi:uncharacterized integral membrane protein